MALNKRTYIDEQTLITAQNLNEIQDAIIASEGNITNLTPLTGATDPTTATAGAVKQLYLNTTDNTLFMCTAATGGTYTWVQVGGGEVTWGTITGTLSAQTDLQNALNAKVPTSRKVNGHALTSDVTITDTEIAHGSSTVGASLDSAFTQIANNLGKSGWNQLVKNGNFVDSTDWTIFNGTIAVASNVASVTLNAIAGGIAQYSSKIINGHKYYTSADVKLSRTATCALSLDFNSINTNQVAIASISANQWTTLNGISSPTNSGGLKVGSSTATPHLEVGDVMQFRNVICVDLTILYGAGNEPTTVAQFLADYPQKFYPYCNATNGMVGDAWVSSKNYVVGEYCIDYNILYRCKVANTNQRPPNITYWTQTSVGAELPLCEDLLSTITSAYGTIDTAKSNFYRYGKMLVGNLRVNLTSACPAAGIVCNIHQQTVGKPNALAKITGVTNPTYVTINPNTNDGQIMLGADAGAGASVYFSFTTILSN